jgi:hypothetical protein
MTYNRNTLFGGKIIASVGFDEQEMIRDILHLHAKDGNIDCDPTYSIGNFYKKGLKEPKYKFDILPQVTGVEKASSENLPLENESINVIMFDPPFIAHYLTGSHGIINKRFTVFDTWDDLKKMYASSMKEFYRILKQKGIVIFKCQDFNGDGNIQYFTHAWVMQIAVDAGFYPKDLFILLNKVRPIIKGVQKIARKYHCYYWVFQKVKNRVDYYD